jgi:hypothetical protein
MNAWLSIARKHHQRHSQRPKTLGSRVSVVGSTHGEYELQLQGHAHKQVIFRGHLGTQICVMLALAGVFELLFRFG